MYCSLKFLISGQTQLFPEICYHCGDDDVVENETIEGLKSEYGIVRPICKNCFKMGRPVVTRNAAKTTKKTRGNVDFKPINMTFKRGFQPWDILI